MEFILSCILALAVLGFALYAIMMLIMGGTMVAGKVQQKRKDRDAALRSIVADETKDIDLHIVDLLSSRVVHQRI